jgi:hypothetical protein
MASHSNICTAERTFILKKFVRFEEVSVADMIITKFYRIVVVLGARGNVVAWVPTLQAGRPRVQFPMSSLDFFQFTFPSSRTMTLGPTQPLTEMRTRNLPGAKERPARKFHNLTAICEPIVWKMWEPPRLKILRASTDC